MTNVFTYTYKNEVIYVGFFKENTFDESMIWWFSFNLDYLVEGMLSYSGNNALFSQTN